MGNEQSLFQSMSERMKFNEKYLEFIRNTKDDQDTMARFEKMMNADKRISNSFQRSNIQKIMKNKIVVDDSLEHLSDLIGRSINHEVNSTIYNTVSIPRISSEIPNILNNQENSPMPTPFDIEFLADQSTLIIEWLYKTLLMGKQKENRYEKWVPLEGYKIMKGQDGSFIDVSSIHQEEGVESYILENKEISLANAGIDLKKKNSENTNLLKNNNQRSGSRGRGKNLEIPQKMSVLNKSKKEISKSKEASRIIKRSISIPKASSISHKELLIVNNNANTHAVTTTIKKSSNNVSPLHTLQIPKGTMSKGKSPQATLNNIKTNKTEQAEADSKKLKQDFDQKTVNSILNHMNKTHKINDNNISIKNVDNPSNLKGDQEKILPTNVKIPTNNSLKKEKDEFNLSINTLNDPKIKEMLKDRELKEEEINFVTNKNEHFDKNTKHDTLQTLTLKIPDSTSPPTPNNKKKTKTNYHTTNKISENFEEERKYDSLNTGFTNKKSQSRSVSAANKKREDQKKATLKSTIQKGGKDTINSNKMGKTLLTKGNRHQLLIKSAKGPQAKQLQTEESKKLIDLHPNLQNKPNENIKPEKAKAKDFADFILQNVSPLKSHVPSNNNIGHGQPNHNGNKNVHKISKTNKKGDNLGYEINVVNNFKLEEGDEMDFKSEKTGSIKKRRGTRNEKNETMKKQITDNGDKKKPQNSNRIRIDLRKLINDDMLDEKPDSSRSSTMQAHSIERSRNEGLNSNQPFSRSRSISTKKPFKRSLEKKTTPGFKIPG
jgi:hypothetical protein